MFEFDPDKSDANLAKHGIDFDRARALWSDEKLLVIGARRDETEDRWLAIGKIEGRLWSAIFTFREANVRIISVRRARRDERKLYEQEEL